MLLKRSFFQQPTLQAAKLLLGKALIRQTKAGPKVGIIVETEAYLGPDDKASHAYKGKTKTNQPMFGPAGYLYVYLIYGMYHCLNVTTEQTGYPAAVLIRALEPIKDPQLTLSKLSLREKRRLASGPGRLCRWLQIDKNFNNKNLNRLTRLQIRQHLPAGSFMIATGPRIGIDYAQDFAGKPWRFFIKSNPFVSR